MICKNYDFYNGGGTTHPNEYGYDDIVIVESLKLILTNNNLS